MRRPVEDAAKRALDLTVATLGLVATAPGLGLIALLVRSSGPGPVIFRQERVGRYGRPFRIHKFRTLRIDASGPLVSASGDGRVTRIGAALRRTKLDELPQLWDVLREAAFPVASAEFRRVVSLPLYSAMTDDEADRVVAVVRRLLS